jgi:hypothetical protein
MVLTIPPVWSSPGYSHEHALVGLDPLLYGGMASCPNEVDVFLCGIGPTEPFHHKYK